MKGSNEGKSFSEKRKIQMQLRIPSVSESISDSPLATPRTKEFIEDVCDRVVTKEHKPNKESIYSPISYVQLVCMHQCKFVSLF